MGSDMYTLHPCLVSTNGYSVNVALQAPSRPFPCHARHAALPSSSCRPSYFSHALQQLRIQPSLHVCKAKDQAQDSKGDPSQVESLLAIFNFGLEFFYNNFLPSILVSAVVLGFFYPSPGQQLYKYGLSKWATFGVFLISGVTLRTRELGGVLQAWPSLLFGVVSSLAITPWIAVLVLRFPIIPREFVTGLALFCCMPTTLSSGVTLTQVAGANTALALSVTLVSNLLGILTIPFMISKVVAPNLGISVPTGPLMKSLVETALVPVLIGKVIRVYTSGFVDEKKKELAILSAIFLGLVPWMQVSCSRDLFRTLKMQNIAAAAVLGLAIHFVFLLWTFLGIHTLHTFIKESKDSHQQKSNAWAVILPASQKTVPIAIAVIGSLHGAIGESGLLVLPCLITHITQIIFDSFLVQTWVQDDLRRSLRTAQ